MTVRIIFYKSYSITNINNTLRYRLGLYENIDIRREIEEKVFLDKNPNKLNTANAADIYPKKLASIINLLEKLMGELKILINERNYINQFNFKFAIKS